MATVFFCEFARTPTLRVNFGCLSQFVKIM